MKKRKCLHCKTYHPHDVCTLTNVGAFCSIDHAIKYAQSKASKARDKKIKKSAASRNKQKKGDRRALMESRRKSLSWQHNLTQKAFNKLRVAEELKWFADRGLKPTCISCGKHLGNDQWCCGHFKTRGAHPELRYDRKNTFLQHNKRCNLELSGDIKGYEKGLLLRFGHTEGQAIIDYCSSHKAPLNWSWQDIEEFRLRCFEQIRGLKRA